MQAIWKWNNKEIQSLLLFSCLWTNGRNWYLWDLSPCSPVDNCLANDYYWKYIISEVKASWCQCCHSTCYSLRRRESLCCNTSCGSNWKFYVSISKKFLPRKLELSLPLHLQENDICYVDDLDKERKGHFRYCYPVVLWRDWLRAREWWCQISWSSLRLFFQYDTKRFD